MSVFQKFLNSSSSSEQHDLIQKTFLFTTPINKSILPNVKGKMLVIMVLSKVICDLIYTARKEYVILRRSAIGSYFYYKEFFIEKETSKALIEQIAKQKSDREKEVRNFYLKFRAFPNKLYNLLKLTGYTMIRFTDNNLFPDKLSEMEYLYNNFYTITLSNGTFGLRKELWEEGVKIQKYIKEKSPSVHNSSSTAIKVVDKNNNDDDLPLKGEFDWINEIVDPSWKSIALQYSKVKDYSSMYREWYILKCHYYVTSHMDKFSYLSLFNRHMTNHMPDMLPPKIEQEVHDLYYNGKCPLPTAVKPKVHNFQGDEILPIENDIDRSGTKVIRNNKFTLGTSTVIKYSWKYQQLAAYCVLVSIAAYFKLSALDKMRYAPITHRSLFITYKWLVYGLAPYYEKNLKF